VLEKFARYLKPGALFFAGHSENLLGMSNFLEPIGGTVYLFGGAQGDVE
jgi:chemotaxis methyl-accepting protein methylase